MYKDGCDTCWSRYFEVFKRKEELAWATDKWLWGISNAMLFKTVIPLRNKRTNCFKLKQY